MDFLKELANKPTVATLQHISSNLTAKPQPDSVRGHTGAKNPSAKLTEAQAQWVIDNHRIIPQRVLAQKLGVSEGMICRIHTGDCWKHLPRKNNIRTYTKKHSKWTS